MTSSTVTTTPDRPGRRRTTSRPAGGTVVSLPDRGQPPGQFPVPGSPDWTYTPDEGVWCGRKLVLPWCPVVTRHLAAFSSRGLPISRKVTITVGAYTHTVSTADVADGSAWVGRFPDAAGAAGRQMREVLCNLVDDQATRLPLAALHPRWDDGRLIMPPVDVLPRGFGEVAGTRDQHRAFLREAGRSGRMALAMGLAVGGLYVSPLGRQSYTAHLVGVSSEGKTTAMRAAAALFGHPDRVVLPWSVTAQGPGSWLRSMVLLTGFRDELGAAGFDPRKLESLMFTLMQGAERDMSSKNGDHRESQGTWHGALISTGNESIVGQITNEGIAARVVELSAPLTVDLAHALTLDGGTNGTPGLLQQTYGHGLADLIERGPTPQQFAVIADRERAELGQAGGVPFRLAGHLAMGIAGALVLAELAGVPEFAAHVRQTARDVLAEMLAGLAERGARPGDRLLAALADALVSAPGAWPTRDAYTARVTGTTLTSADGGGWRGARDVPVDREVSGWDLINDTAPGELAVIPSALRSIAADANITDLTVALKDLRKRGMLLARKDLQGRLRVADRVHRVYVVTGVCPDDPTEDTTESAQSGPVAAVPAEPAQPAGPSEEGGQMTTGGQQPAPVVTIADTDQPCGKCGHPTRVRTNGRPAHAGDCTRTTAPARPAATRPAPVPAEPDEYPNELADFTRAIRRAVFDGDDQADIDPVTARAALGAWHVATDGLRFLGWAGDTGVAAYEWCNAKRGAASRGEAAHRLDSDAVRAFSADALLHTDYVHPGVVPTLDQAVTQLDVYGQFLSASNMLLGTGEPIRLDRPTGLAGLMNQPGYVRLAADVDTDLPAFAGRLVKGRVLVMPHVQYLTKHGVDLPAREALVWAKGNARTHLGLWRGVFAGAWRALVERDDTASVWAFKVLKSVYVVTVGRLRSEDNETDLMRRDWSDHIITESGTRALVALAKAEQAGVTALGMRRDSAWFLADSAPVVPAGITTEVKLGKWKVDRWADVTPELIEAHTTGSADMVNRAVKAANDARKADQ